MPVISLFFCCWKWIPLITIFNKVYIKTGFLHEVTPFPGEYYCYLLLLLAYQSDTSFSACLDTFISNLMHGWYSSDEIPFEMSKTPFIHSEIEKYAFVMNILRIWYTHTPRQIHFSIICRISLSLSRMLLYSPFSDTGHDLFLRTKTSQWMVNWFRTNWCDAAAAAAAATVAAKNPTILNVSCFSAYSKVLLCVEPESYEIILLWYVGGM